MKRQLLCIILCFFNIAVLAQKEGYVWAWGQNAGYDFNSGSPVAISTAFNSYGECAASVCDKNGQLQFYTDGSIIWDRIGNQMPNADNLTGLPFLNTMTPTGSCTQGAVIMPMPDSEGKYYVFSLSEGEEMQKAGRLYYSVVDMSLNGGLGDIVPSRKGILIDSGLTEKMTAVKGNHCNLWLLCRSLQNASFKAYEITDAGINTVPVISQANAFNPGVYEVGTMKVSPDRRKIISANCYPGYGLELADFDPATGIVSNPVKLDNDSYYGSCFSPDNSKVYASEYLGTFSLFQFDISSAVPSTMVASKVNVGGGGWTDLKLGPDNKIYMNGAPDLGAGVINYPNNSSLACDAGQNGVLLLPGSDYQHGLPNEVAVLVRDTAPPTTQIVQVCFTDSTVLYANDSGWNYLWDDGSIQTYRPVYTSGSYVVHYSTAPCTYHTDTFKVKLIPLPSIGSLSGCYGHHNGRAWVQPQPGDTSMYTFTWTDSNGTQLQLPITASGISDTLQNQWPGTYIINIHSRSGCDTSLSVVIDTPQYSDYIHVTDTGICPHDTITLHATGGVVYRWSPDSKTYISDTTIADPKVCPPTDWNYIVYGENTSGCFDTATAHIKVYPNAVIQLPDSIILYYGESYLFKPGTNCITFNWFPPQGLSADDISDPVASPEANTEYIVTGTTENGCTVKQIVNVYRDDDVLLTLPNAFAPGNGPNNLLKPIYKGNVTLDYLRIFNRWGQMVYESSDLNAGWDGAWHGTPQAGVFVYIMQAHTADGKILSKQGNVTIIR